MHQFFQTCLFTTLFFLSFLLTETPHAEDKIHPLVVAAKDQVGKTIRYNPQYQKLKYPLGDVPLEEGVCTDVIIRGFQDLGCDLQALVHDDMKNNWCAYPKKWGLKGTDSNIDHRRVPNLMTYFHRHKMTVTDGLFQPGDIVVWDLGGGILHIGILSTTMVKSLLHRPHPLVFHNIARGVQEEDILKSYKVVGHYRLKA